MFSGIFSGLLVLFMGYLSLGYLGAPLIAWAAFTAISFFLLGVPKFLILLALAPFFLLMLPVLRRPLITDRLVALINSLNLMPKISETEKVALDAGTTWVEGEIFCGKPDIKKMMSQPYGKLSGEEKSFIEVQCRKVCEMVNDWKVYQDRDLPPEVWQFLKDQGFFGFNIPKEYGGHGFSALANSEIVSTLSSRSIPLAISVMVPNSLGPAELLVHYGTEAQKNYYLPRLAKGVDIPCFGLTETNAGSDAGAIESEALVFMGSDGKLYLRVNWSKRYITLGAISTLIGLAVKLKDPENLLGKGKSPGITCLLIPADSKGVQLGFRHDPLGVPFYNCPIEGHNVEVSVDQIVGGPEFAGQGWRMLMECLAAGRSISLPGQGAGGAKLASRVSSAYAEVRQQFGIPISNFEGIIEQLSYIGGMTYLAEAARIYTVGAVDSGLKPSVVSAIAKYNVTEICRKIINASMDVVGGSGISMGPRNLLAHTYIAQPIGITVEGANILTRTMIIFGQGALRCHPYAYQELKALADKDFGEFDRVFFKHIGHVISNACRSFLLSITRGHLYRPTTTGPMSRYHQKLAWSSASFAFFADVAMGSYGGGLKFKEQITGRYADVLSWLYLITAVLRRFEAEGQQKEAEPFAHYAIQYGFAQVQQAFDGIFANLEVPFVRGVFQYGIRFWSRMNTISNLPGDKLGGKLVHEMIHNDSMRDALTSVGTYISHDPQDALARLEKAFVMVKLTEPLLAKVNKAVRKKEIDKGPMDSMLKSAVGKSIITENDRIAIMEAFALRQDAIRVDSFTLEQYLKQEMVNPLKAS